MGVDLWFTHCLKIILLFRYVNSRVWSQAGHFNKALSKGPKTTTWIWNLHSSPHDFDMGQGGQGAYAARVGTASPPSLKQWGASSLVPSLVTRKVFSSSLAHLSLVFFWIGGMTFHGAYFSNYSAWLKDPKGCLPSAHPLSSLIGQDILNSDVGGYFEGIRITSGFFQLWRAMGMVTQVHLKYASAAALIGTIITLFGSYFHMHLSPLALAPQSTGYKKWSTPLATHHLLFLLGLGSISWSGHEIHISLPITTLLDGGIDPSLIPSPQDLLFSDLIRVVYPGFGVAGLVDFSIYLPEGVGIWSFVLNSSGGALFLGQIAAHHFYLGVLLIISGLIVLGANRGIPNASKQVSSDIRALGVQGFSTWHSDLSINLAITG